MITATTITTVQERWSDDNFVAMAKAWKFNPEQLSKMRQLQPLLQDIDHWKNDPHEVARYLVDFYKFPIDKIAAKVRDMIQWRITNHMDTFCETYGVPPPIYQYFPIYLLRDLDKDGDPIYVIKVGSLDAWGFYQKAGPESIAAYFDFLQEIVSTRHRRHGKCGVPQHWNWQTEYYEPLRGGPKFTQFTVVVDLEGLSYGRHLRPALLGVLKEVSRTGQDYYAGVRKRILIVRAPRLFAMAWNAVKHFFDPHVIELISICTTADYLKVCDQYMDLKVLPECICPGEGQGEAMPGYFQDYVRLDGGILPDNISAKQSGAGYEHGLATKQDQEDTFELSSSEDDEESELVFGSTTTKNQGTTAKRATSTSQAIAISTKWLCSGSLASNNQVIVHF